MVINQYRFIAMKQNFIQTLQDYVQDGMSAQSLGSAMLQCNGMFVPDNMPDIAVLIPNYSSPVITNNESADFNLAGGAQFYVAGAPKNRYEGQIQIIETDFGQAGAFAELLMASGGTTDGYMYDGRQGRYIKAHRLTNITFTFEPKDIDGEGVSTIQRIQGSIKYNYYGQMANLGGANNIGALGGISEATQGVMAKAQKLLDMVYAGNTLIRSMRDIF